MDYHLDVDTGFSEHIFNSDNAVQKMNCPLNSDNEWTIDSTIHRAPFQIDNCSIQQSNADNGISI